LVCSYEGCVLPMTQGRKRFGIRATTWSLVCVVYHNL
jgi:hypothetical protein